MKKNDYDFIAGAYDALAKLVFRQTLDQAKLSSLKYINSPANILLIGGGTGKLLNPLLDLHNENRITYVDLSVQMMKKAKSKIPDEKQAQVTFCPGDFIQFNHQHQFDVVITNFFLDQFQGNFLQQMVTKIDSLLKEEGIWCFADFNWSKQHKIWQKALIRLMYIFFKFTTNISASHLPHWQNVLPLPHYSILSRSYLNHQLILCMVTKKAKK